MASHRVFVKYLCQEFFPTGRDFRRQIGENIRIIISEKNSKVIGDLSELNLQTTFTNLPFVRGLRKFGGYYFQRLI